MVVLHKPGNGHYRFWHDFPTSDTAEHAHDEQAFQRAVEAYRFFFRPSRPRASSTAAGESASRTAGSSCCCRPRRATWSSPPTPNAVRLGVLDLLAMGPTVVELPPGPYIGLIDDHNQRWIVDLGIPGPDGGNGGKYLVLPRASMATSLLGTTWRGPDVQGPARPACPAGGRRHGRRDGRPSPGAGLSALEPFDGALPMSTSPTGRSIRRRCGGKTTWSTGAGCRAILDQEPASMISGRCTASWPRSGSRGATLRPRAADGEHPRGGDRPARSDAGGGLRQPAAGASGLGGSPLGVGRPGARRRQLRDRVCPTSRRAIAGSCRRSSPRRPCSAGRPASARSTSSPRAMAEARISTAARLQARGSAAGPREAVLVGHRLRRQDALAGRDAAGPGRARLAADHLEPGADGAVEIYFGRKRRPAGRSSGSRPRRTAACSSTSASTARKPPPWTAPGASAT